MIVLFFASVALGAGFFHLYRRVDNLTDSVSSLTRQTESPQTREPTPAVGDEVAARDNDQLLAIVDEKIQAAIEGLPTPGQERVVEREVVTQETSGTDYVPMGATHTTTSKDWSTIDDTAVYIDLINDYSSDATVSWEASLKVAHANGQAFARLYDATNNIAVDFSELTTKDNDSFERVSSGNLPFWRGRNLYKVQIKSLNGFEVTYSGGKIKIRY